MSSGWELTMAGRIILRKCEQSIRAVEWWARITLEAPHLFDDSPSKTPNHARFQQHFHDQAVWSMILANNSAKYMHACPEEMPIGRYCKSHTVSYSYKSMVELNNVVWPCFTTCRFLLAINKTEFSHAAVP